MGKSTLASLEKKIKKLEALNEDRRKQLLENAGSIAQAKSANLECEKRIEKLEQKHNITVNFNKEGEFAHQYSI